MKKISFILLGLLLTHPVFSGDFPSIQQTRSSKLLKPIFKAIGYRPLGVHIYNRDTAQPIQDAIVMVSEKLDPSQTFLWTKTDAKGNASFDGFTLPEGQITISAAHQNYSRYTLFLTEGDKIEIPLTSLEDDDQKTVLKGAFNGWPEMEDYDGTLHLGFMFPFLDIVTLLNFDTDKILAPYVKAQIYEQMMVPGNLVAPTQEESVFGLLSLFVSKPMYQMPFPRGSRQNLVAISGEVPIDQLARSFSQKKPVIEMMNMITMTRVGMGFNIAIPEQTARRDLHLGFPMNPKFEVAVENPLPNKDLIYISSGAFENGVSSIFPVDFKVKGRNEWDKRVTLKSIEHADELPPFRDEIAVIHADLPKTMDGSRQELDGAMSAALARPEPLQTDVTLNSFLSFIDLSANGAYHFSYRYREPTPPPTTEEPQLSLSFLNIEIKPSKEDKGYKKTWWTVLAPAHVREFTLPTLPGGLSQLPSLKPKEELNFTMNLFKTADQPFHYHSFNEGMLASRLTHFSRNKIKIEP